MYVSREELIERFPKASRRYIDFSQTFFEGHQEDSLTEAQYWSLIVEARSEVATIKDEMERMRAHRNALDQLFSNLSSSQLYNAAKFYFTDFERLYDKRYWSAFNLVTNGLNGDDSFMDFRSWLISLGPEPLKAFEMDPDVLPDLMNNASTDWPTFEGAIIGSITKFFEQQNDEFEIPLIDVEDGPLHPRGDWIDEDEAERQLPRCRARGRLSKPEG